MRLIMLKLFVAFAMLLLGSTAGAFPTKPIRIVIPFAVGGTADPLARLLADVIEKKTGAKFVIDSRPGAGGNLGNQTVAAADKDGHTVLLGANNNFVVNQFLLPQSAVDVGNAFALISILVDQPQVVYVRSDLPINSLKELIDYIKSKPGQINYASPGAGSAPHLSGEILSDLYGLQMVHVPYKGGAPAITALLSGDVQLYLASLSVGRSNIQSGKLKALATTSAVRLGSLPNVATTKELGFGEYKMVNWWALAAPKGTPKANLDWIQREFALAMREPEVIKRLEDLGFVIVGGTAEHFEERFKKESAEYQQLIKARQISAQ